MTIIRLISEDFVIRANRKICGIHKNHHFCAQEGRVGSILNTSFFPGSAPFQHGGVTGMAAAVFFFIIKSHVFFDANKRTAVICTLAVMECNGWTLRYPMSDGFDALVEAAEAVARNELTLPDTKAWFDAHKIEAERVIG